MAQSEFSGPSLGEAGNMGSGKERYTKVGASTSGSFSCYFLFSNTKPTECTRTNMIVDITFTFSVSGKPPKSPRSLPCCFGLRTALYSTHRLSNPHAGYLKLEKAFLAQYSLKHKHTKFKVEGKKKILLWP